MRLDVRHRLKPPSSPAAMLARHAWKLGLGLVVAALLTARGVTQAPVHLPEQPLAAGGGPTAVSCGALPAGTTTWNAAGSPYILPVNATNDPIPNDPTACPAFPAAGEPQPASPPGVVVLPGSTLVIDAAQGPVQIFSHGSGITVDGGELRTINTSAIPPNFVSFDAEPDVASWDGISIIASDSSHRGNGSLSYTSIAHALTSISITSGATSSPDSGSYGLTVHNSGVGPSYFDGIDATNTPISVSGRVDPLTLRPDGQFGTLNNIGSQGIKVTYDAGLPNYPAAIPDKALDVENVTFGSSVPFGETTCVPLQPCAAGSIGNDAIQGNFVTGQPPIKLDNNSFFRAGSYGLELANANNPTITNNTFTCNGSGSPKPVVSCVGSGLRYSAIYLSGVTNLNVGAGALNNNKGQQNGLDAIVLNGQVVSDLPWQTPWNDPTPPPLPPLPPNAHTLGYIVANGDLQLVNSKLTVNDGDVVKVKGGAILISNGSLNASSAGLKTFTSLRDNTIGIQACPSVFVQSCPSPLPANEWIGLNLVGSTGNIANASILFPTKAIDISGGQASLIGPDGGSYALVVTKSRLGPTFSDSVAVSATPVYISGSKFCRIDTIPTDVTYLQCAGAGPGDHGINASYSGTPAAGGGLKILGNDFQGSTNEAIVGTALGGRTVDIENDTVEGAGTYGMHLASADNLTLKGNRITASGIGNPANTTTYPAIYLDGISKADFSGPISANTGASNGLNAIAFHGSTADSKPLDWMTVGASGDALGYLVDGDLAVNGDLTLFAHDYAPVLGGAITMNHGLFTATSAVVSSLREQAPHLPTCGSVFVPRISGVCPAAAPGDWKGLVLDPSKANQLTDSEVRYAVTGISVGPPTVPPVALNLTMIRSNVRNTTADGVATQSPLSITDGAFTGNAGRGIKVDLTAVSPSSAQQLVITGHTSITGSGQDGIQAIALGGHPVTITGVSVDRAGAFGINLQGADNLTLTNNTVTNSAATYPAIYLNGFTGPFGTSVSPFIFNNMGAGNGIDAIAFHGTVTDNLVWQTAHKTSDPTQLLGYVLDNTLNMLPGHTLTVSAGGVVKVGNGGMLNLQGVTLRADGTESGAQKVFTSLTDNTAGVVACPSVLQSGCGPSVAASPGDWAGISLSGSLANGTLVNASVRYAATAINITNGATSTNGSSSFGLVVSQSTVASSNTDGIFASNTATSVTDSLITGGVHGANVNLSGDPAAPAAVRLSGNRFTSQTAEAILGQGLFGQPVWITDNRVQKAGTFGIRLLSSNNLVLRNNNVVGSGGGPGAGAGRYPAIYLPNVSADFARNVRGNVGSGNGLDSIAFDGTVTSSLTWVTPGANTTTGPLGYLLDGGLTLDGTTLTVGHDDVVKALGGPITINGGSLNAVGTLGHEAIFTSLKDNASGTVGNAVSCPSVFVSASDCAQPQAGNWGGIAITDKAGQRGNNTIDHSVIEYAITGISIDSGPVTTALPNLKVTNSRILHTSLDGISASDTPIDVEASTIGDQTTPAGAPADIRAHGIIASFFSPANCPSPAGCKRLTLVGNHIYSTGKDGIVANGLGGQPTVVSDNTVTDSGTYGIRLVGADQLTATTNHVRKSAPPAAGSLRYPAIYLSSVKADFETSAGTGAIVQGNDGKWTGMDAIVLHGEATKTLAWITAAAAPSGPLPVADVRFGYLLDGSLTVDGDFVTNGDIVKTLNGGIKINGGSLQSVGSLFTSLKDSSGMSACQSVFIPTCPSSPAAGDWNGINIDTTDSVFNGGTLLYASSGITINSASLKVNNSVIKGLSGYAVTTTGTASAQIDCASIHGNSGGVFSKGAATTSVNNSNLYGNSSATTKDLDATVATTAAGDWWNPTTPPNPDAGQYNATYVTVTSPLPQERPTLNAGSGSVTVTSNNTNANGNLGKGTLTVTLTFDRKMNVNVPLVVTFLGPGETVAHVVTGSWNSDNTSWTGTAAVDPTTNSAGLNTLTVTMGTSCVPDGPNVMNPETATFTLDFSKAAVTGVGSAQSVGARSATFNELVNPNGWSTQKDTYVFFQYRLDGGGSYDASVIAGIQAGTLNPSGLLGYQLIGHGTAAVPVSAQVSQLLSPATNYDYRAVAVDLNGITTTGPDHFFTTLAAATHLDVTGAASTTAGASLNVTVTARNATATVIDYAGTVSFSSSDPQFAAPSPGTLSNGTATFNATLKTAGSQSITASDGVISGQLTPITVNPAAANSLKVAAPATATAGSPFSVTVTAKDAFNNTATGYVGTVQFTSTDVQAVLPSAYTFVAGDNGSHAGFSVTLKTTGSQTVTATDTVTSSITGSQPVTIGPNVATALQLSGLSGGIAGSAQTATVTARDAFNNVATGYIGTIHFTSSDGQAVLAADYTFGGADNGVHAFTGGVTLKTAATQSVTVTDTVTSSLTATQNGLVITPAAAATLQLTYAGPVTHGVAFTITVTTLDAFSNTATGYTGTVHFTSSDLVATLPADYTFAAGDNGVRAFTNGVTLSAAGSPTVTATDTMTSTITGTVTVTVT